MTTKDRAEKIKDMPFCRCDDFPHHGLIAALQGQIPIMV